MWSPNLKFLHQAFYRKSLPTPAESECLCLDPVASFHQLNLEQITQLTYPVFLICVSLLWFSRSAMSNSLQPHGLHHTKFLGLPLSPRVFLVHGVTDAIQPSHPLLPPSPPAFNLSQYQSFFQWVSSSHQVAKVLELQLQHQSFQWIFRTVFL